jgi:hypothetical protein
MSTSRELAATTPTTPPATTAGAQDPTASTGSPHGVFNVQAVHADQNIPIDADPDADSAYGDAEDYLSDTTSIPSTIMRHRWENGRRYNKLCEGEYYAPNDEEHADMMDITHHMYLTMLHNKLHLAPIGKTTPSTSHQLPPDISRKSNAHTGPRLRHWCKHPNALNNPPSQFLTFKRSGV